MIIIRVQSYILCKRVDYIVVTKTFSYITSCHFSLFPSLFSSPGLPFPADFADSFFSSRRLRGFLFLFTQISRITQIFFLQTDGHGLQRILLFYADFADGD